jgi:hypothetical protein
MAHEASGLGIDEERNSVADENGTQGTKKKLKVGLANEDMKGNNVKKKKVEANTDGPRSGSGIEVEQKSVADENGTGKETNDADDWNMNDWYWDETFGAWGRWSEKYQTWVYGESKRVRKKDLTNKMEKNWLMGMRRNWNTEKREQMIAKITIKRDNINTVRKIEPLLIFFRCHCATEAVIHIYCHYRCTVGCTKTASALLKIFR